MHDHHCWHTACPDDAQWDGWSEYYKKCMHPGVATFPTSEVGRLLGPLPSPPPHVCVICASAGATCRARSEHATAPPAAAAPCQHQRHQPAAIQQAIQTCTWLTWPTETQMTHVTRMPPTPPLQAYPAGSAKAYPPPLINTCQSLLLLTGCAHGDEAQRTSHHAPLFARDLVSFLRTPSRCDCRATTLHATKRACANDASWKTSPHTATARSTDSLPLGDAATAPGRDAPSKDVRCEWRGEPLRIYVLARQPPRWPPLPMRHQRSHGHRQLCAWPPHAPRASACAEAATVPTVPAAARTSTVASQAARTATTAAAHDAAAAAVAFLRAAAAAATPRAVCSNAAIRDARANATSQAALATQCSS